MFGHNENTTDDTQHSEPQHDAVLGDDANTVHPDDGAAPHTDDATVSVSPAFTSAPPATAASSDDHAEPPTHAVTDSADHGHMSDTLDTSGANGDLLTIKQSALKQLSPLVDHLDQTPEEKFRTTMMMIQASDDQSLLKEAYDSAQKITDEKTKAQALLDIVNEINYFTQHS
jgi:hypothetical protein